jgi:hypothetical protein
LATAFYLMQDLDDLCLAVPCLFHARSPLVVLCRRTLTVSGTILREGYVMAYWFSRHGPIVVIVELIFR